MRNKLRSMGLIIIALLFGDAVYASSMQPISDTVITTKIKAKLLKDYSNIHVATNNGIVTLKGTVNAQTDAVAIMEKVEATAGVKNINTKHFYVHGSKHIVPDAIITAKVKGMLIQEKLLGEKEVNPWISVETTNSTVYLSGKAISKQQIDEAVAITKSIEGVKEVNYTQLKVVKSY